MQWFGILLTAVVIAGVDIAANEGARLSDPGFVYWILIVVVTLVSGMWIGLLATGLLVAYLLSLPYLPFSAYSGSADSMSHPWGHLALESLTAILVGGTGLMLRRSALRTWEAQVAAQSEAEKSSELAQVNTELQQEVARRRDAESQIEEQRRDLHAYIDSMSTMNAKVAPDGTILLANRAAQMATGLGYEELLRTNFLEGNWWSFDPEVRDRVKAAFARATLGETVHQEEKAFVFDGVRDIIFSLVPVANGDGEVDYILAEGRDITELKEIERELQERSLQLEAANRELESFSHSVSHDLRAPLRALDGFSLALLDDYSDRLDEEGREHLRRLRSASQRMSQLIDALLNLSRVSRTEMMMEKVSLSALAQSIASDLRDSEPNRKARFVIPSGIDVVGDKRLMRVLLQNLMENAWKFTGRNKELPMIELGEIGSDGGTAYYVKDNGAGFDMAYAANLFMPFQRLHRANEFEGTGIGLATVQRIVQRHGGKVWAESEPGKGATFWFTV